MKRVIRIPEDEHFSVEYAFGKYAPVTSIRRDRNGRKQLIRVPLVSQNGRHVICRDIGDAKFDMYWDYYPVDKIVISDFEVRIHLRRMKKACIGS